MEICISYMYVHYNHRFVDFNSCLSEVTYIKYVNTEGFERDSYVCIHGYI